MKNRPEFLLLPYTLTNFEIQKYENEPIFKGVCLKNKLPKIKNVAYALNLGYC